MAVQQGKVKTWKDDKGFGFITPDNGGGEIFFHISDVTHSRSRPAAQTPVTYTLAYDQNQRPRAVNVSFAQARSALAPLPLAIVGVFFLTLALATYIISIPIWVIIGYAVGSCITFFVYRTDKASAKQGTQRIPEATLHLLELLGGWPGALLAQDYYRHKTKKASYQFVYWAIVLGNLLTLIVGSGILRGE